MYIDIPGESYKIILILISINMYQFNELLKQGEITGKEKKLFSFVISSYGMNQSDKQEKRIINDKTSIEADGGFFGAAKPT